VTQNLKQRIEMMKVCVPAHKRLEPTANDVF